MKKSSTSHKIFKIFLKAILLLLTSSIYFLLTNHEAKNSIEIGVRKTSNLVRNERIFERVIKVMYVHFQDINQNHTKVEIKRRKPACITTESTEITTLNPIYEYSEEINAQTELDFKKRRDHLWKTCAKNHMINALKPNSKEFILTHDLAWCTIFKAASTTFLFFMKP